MASRSAPRECRRRDRGGPCVVTSVSAPEWSTVRRGVRIDDVGFTAKRTTIGWPVEMPPKNAPGVVGEKGEARIACAHLVGIFDAG